MPNSARPRHATCLPASTPPRLSASLTSTGAAALPAPAPPQERRHLHVGGGRAHLPQPLRAHRLALPGTRPVHPHRPPPAPCSLLYAPCPLPPATYLDEHSFFPSPPLPLTPQSSPLPLPSLLPRRSRLSSTAALPPWPALTSMQSRSVRSRSLRQRSTPPYILQRLIPLTPVTPLASLTPLHISRYPLTPAASSHRHSRRRWPSRTKPRRRRLPRAPSSTSRCSS